MTEMGDYPPRLQFLSSQKNRHQLVQDKGEVLVVGRRAPGRRGGGAGKEWRLEDCRDLFPRIKCDLEDN